MITFVQPYMTNKITFGISVMSYCMQLGREGKRSCYVISGCAIWAKPSSSMCGYAICAHPFIGIKKKLKSSYLGDINHPRLSIHVQQVIFTKVGMN